MTKDLWRNFNQPLQDMIWNLFFKTSKDIFCGIDCQYDSNTLEPVKKKSY